MSRAPINHLSSLLMEVASLCLSLSMMLMLQLLQVAIYLRLQETKANLKIDLDRPLLKLIYAASSS